MKIIVSDMGGVVYSFDSSFDPKKHDKNFQRAMKEIGLESVSIKKQLTGEWKAINKGLLRIYPIELNIKNLLKILKLDYKLVIVSTSLIKTSKLILDKFGLTNKVWKIYDMSEYGSKRDENAWKKIFRKLPAVDVIVEDGESNLQTAGLAANKLGYSPKTYKEVPFSI